MTMFSLPQIDIDGDEENQPQQQQGQFEDEKVSMKKYSLCRVVAKVGGNE